VAVARGAAFRSEYFPFSNLEKNANVLIFPDLQSSNLAMQSLQYMGDAKPIGPMLMGTRLPAHCVQYGATVEEVVNVTAVAIVEAAALRKAG
jgi:malate dehydrogenase (oxaloacetate-decarboxylating)(NADP+)